MLDAALLAEALTGYDAADRASMPVATQQMPAAAGARLFLADFPGVSREHVLKVLRLAVERH